MPITEALWLIALGWISLRLRAAIVERVRHGAAHQPHHRQLTDLSSFKPLIGNVGMLLSALLMSALYLAAGRTLWLPILAHGFSDTIALLLIFFDLVPELRQ